MSAFRTPVRTFQLWSNEFIRDKRLPLGLLPVRPEPPAGRVDGATAARVREIKRCLGYAPKYANAQITDLLLRQLQRPLWRSLFSPVQWQRGLRYRRNLRNRPPGTTAALARAVLLHKNARFSYVSPTGGSARAGLVAASEGRKSYVADTGGWTYIDRRILRFLLECCKRGPTLINAVTNGDHLDYGDHPKGQAADIDKTSRTDVYGAARAAGVNVLEERYHRHCWV